MRIVAPVAFALCCFANLPACTASGDDGDGDGTSDGSESLTTGSSSSTSGSTDSGSTDSSGPETSGDGDGDTSTTGDGDGDSSTTGTTGTTGDGDGDGDAPPRVETMQTYLDDALDRAAEIDADAYLVQINGMGVDSDGTVDLEGNTGYVRRWNFGFKSPSGDISVIYMSEDWTGSYPEVQHPAGNVVSTEAITNPTALPDSDAVAAAFAGEAGCGTLDGSESANLLYRHDANLGGNLVQITANGVTWGATTDGGFGVWDSCQ